MPFRQPIPGFRVPCRGFRGIGAASCRAGARGFSLVELLTVMAIFMVLMGLASGLLGYVGSRTAEPAARIARGLEFARAQAVARNRSVAVRFDWIDDRELAMRFLWSRPGQAAGEVAELRRPERLENLAITPNLRLRKPLPNTLPSHHLAADEALVFTADGQVFVGTGRRGFPLKADELKPLIYLGVQTTRNGKVVAADRHDVDMVEVQCATGTARVLPP